MQRRSFLKILGVGAAAPAVAPKPIALLTESPVSGMAMNSALMPEWPSDPYDPIPEKKKGKWERIKELKQLISGETEEEEEAYTIRQRLGLYEEYRLNGLRSISLAHKARMLHRKMRVLSAAEHKRYWLKELFRKENDEEE